MKHPVHKKKSALAENFFGLDFEIGPKNGLFLTFFEKSGQTQKVWSKFLGFKNVKKSIIKSAPRVFASVLISYIRFDFGQKNNSKSQKL